MKRAISFVMSVCLSARNGAARNGWILEKTDIGGSLWKSVEKLEILL